MALPELSTFRLVGGTSLALQIGHRTSIDIDLFTDASFDNRELQLALSQQFASFQVLWQGRHGFSAGINNVKIDLFNWQVVFLNPPLIVDSLRMMDKQEIGAMKLDAITSRKDKKDFIDLYFLLKDFSLADLINSFRIKYPYTDYKFVLESIAAIDLADETETPVMMLPCNWQEAKQTIKNSIVEFVADLKIKIEAQKEERLRKAEELLNKKKKN